MIIPIFTTGDTTEELITSLEKSSKKLFEWFEENQMKGNTDKYHLITNSKEAINVKIGQSIVSNNKCMKLLGINIDNNLNFDIQIDEMYKKATRKLNALSRIVSYMSLPKRKIRMNSFFSSAFNYCPLVWMCHSRKNNNRINRIHERCLRLIYNDKTFMELLNKDRFLTGLIFQEKFLWFLYQIQK